MVKNNVLKGFLGRFRCNDLWYALLTFKMAYTENYTTAEVTTSQFTWNHRNIAD
jgi:hypothetical protein